MNKNNFGDTSMVCCWIYPIAAARSCVGALNLFEGTAHPDFGYSSTCMQHTAVMRGTVKVFSK